MILFFGWALEVMSISSYKSFPWHIVYTTVELALLFVRSFPAKGSWSIRRCGTSLGPWRPDLSRGRSISSRALFHVLIFSSFFDFSKFLFLFGISCKSRVQQSFFRTKPLSVSIFLFLCCPIVSCRSYSHEMYPGTVLRLRFHRLSERQSPTNFH